MVDVLLNDLATEVAHQRRHEAMQAPHLLDDPLTGPLMEVVGVREDDLDAQLVQVPEPGVHQRVEQVRLPPVVPRGRRGRGPRVRRLLTTSRPPDAVIVFTAATKL